MRDSYISAFLAALSNVSFSSFYDMAWSVDEKCSFFADAILSCFVDTIPAQTVIMTDKDKPYITPLIKHLINTRWRSYRQRNFPLYQHLGSKIKKLLIAQKRKWAMNARNSPKEMWKIVNESTGRNSSRKSASNVLVKQFSSPSAAVEEINSMFSSFQAIRPAPGTVDDSPDWMPAINVETGKCL